MLRRDKDQGPSPENKKVRYCRGTAQRTMSVEIWSTVAHMYEKSHLKRFAVGEYTIYATFREV